MNEAIDDRALNTDRAYSPRGNDQKFAVSFSIWLAGNDHSDFHQTRDFTCLARSVQFADRSLSPYIIGMPRPTP